MPSAPRPRCRSSTQQYHAVSLIRGLLGAGRGAVTVRATRFIAPLMSPLSRAGWTDEEEAHPRPPRSQPSTSGTDALGL